MTVTVLPGPERRRRWTTAEKLRIVEESETAEIPIVEVARRHGIHPNQLHGWRRQARLGLSTQECRLVPIAVAPAESKVCEQPKAAVSDAPPIIELVLRNGRVLRLPETGSALARGCGAGTSRRARWSVGGWREMIAIPSGVQVWLATGHTDMRKGFDGLAVLVQEVLKRDPHKGHLFVFRGRRGGLIKVLWHDGQGMCLFAKRLERGRFIWPSTVARDSAEVTVTITLAQLGYLLEGIDWRLPQHPWRPQAAG